jgi:signal transduction histidine kinase
MDLRTEVNATIVALTIRSLLLILVGHLSRNWVELVKRLSLFQRFSIIGFIIMVLGTLGIGLWLGVQIKSGVIRESASTSALYMDSFIAPNLQELATSKALTPWHIGVLSRLLSDTSLGRQIVTFKVWDQNGGIIYSSNPALIGRVFPVDEDLLSAWQGNIAANISDLQGDENVEERRAYSRLLQVYSPIRLSGTDRIIAVAEFYQTVESLQDVINTSQWRTWLAVGLTMLLIYLALVTFVRWTSRTIGRQEIELTRQVQRLRELLAQNGELRERIQRAAGNAAEVNERFLRRISAELHDGPVQELGAALLRMDRVIAQSQTSQHLADDRVFHEQLPAIQSSLQNAIHEVRSLASGLGMPQLEGLNLNEVLARVVDAHERRTGTRVKLVTVDLPEQTELPVKIAVYRIIQESLNNAYRHAAGAGQSVSVKCKSGQIQIEVSDQGPGFDTSLSADWEEHLGLAGMRQRVESLGGSFAVESKINHGSRVIVTMPLQSKNKNDEASNG